jgi:CHASE2 domain-containing sensor protein
MSDAERGGKGSDAAQNPAGAVMPWLQGSAGVASMLAILALLFVPAAAELALIYFEQPTGDKRTAMFSQRSEKQHDQIAMVTISEETLRGYATVSPVDRGLLARIVTAVDAANPRAIGLDIFFLRPTDEAKDAALIEAIRKTRSELVLAAIDERGQLEPYQRDFQAEFLKRTGRSIGYINLRTEKDSVVRNTAAPCDPRARDSRCAAGAAYPKSFARLLAAAAGADQPDAQRPISWLLPPLGGSKRNFLTIPAHELIASGSQSARLLEGKIVLIGGDFPNRDRHRIPLNTDKDEDVIGLFIHAQLVAARLDPARALWQLAPSRERMLLMGLAILGFLIGWRMWDSAVVNLIAWTFATVALIGLDAVLFMYTQLLLPFTLALLSWFLGVTGGRFTRGWYEHFFERRPQT